MSPIIPCSVRVLTDVECLLLQKSLFLIGFFIYLFIKSLLSIGFLYSYIYIYIIWYFLVWCLSWQRQFMTSSMWKNKGLISGRHDVILGISGCKMHEKYMPDRFQPLQRLKNTLKRPKMTQNSPMMSLMEGDRAKSLRRTNEKSAYKKQTYKIIKQKGPRRAQLCSKADLPPTTAPTKSNNKIVYKNNN